MRMVDVRLRVPEGMVPYLSDEGREASFERDAMLLYPLIRKAVISHGRVAEILGVRKWDLIEFYDSIGIPYLDQSKEELLTEIASYEDLKGQRP